MKRPQAACKSCLVYGDAIAFSIRLPWAACEDSLPRLPSGKAVFISGARHRQDTASERKTQRWILCVHDPENGRRFRIAAFLGRKTPGHTLSKIGIDIHSGCPLQRRRARKFRGIGPGLDQGNLDTKVFHLLRQAIVEGFDGPFGSAIEADERHSH